MLLWWLQLVCSLQIVLTRSNCILFENNVGICQRSRPVSCLCSSIASMGCSCQRYYPGFTSSMFTRSHLYREYDGILGFHRACHDWYEPFVLSTNLPLPHVRPPKPETSERSFQSRKIWSHDEFSRRRLEHLPCHFPPLSFVSTGDSGMIALLSY